MSTLKNKIEKISGYLERFPEDRIEILSDINEICNEADCDDTALKNIEAYLFGVIPLVYSNPVTVQIYAEVLDVSLNDMFEAKKEMLEEAQTTDFTENVYSSSYIRTAEIAKSHFLGMDIENKGNV